MKRVFLFLMAAVTMASCCNSSIYKVEEFGAIGDGKSINTKAIQSAIDKCSQSGGGTVVLTEGDYVSSTIMMRDDVTLRVEKGARLVGSRDINSYELVDPFVDATGQLRGKCLIGAIDVKNIGIEGEGDIEGSGEAFHPSNRPKRPKGTKYDKSKECVSPFMVRLVRCNDVTIKGVKMNQPGAWCVHLYECDGFLIDGLRIYSHAVKNNDGIDLDSSSNGEIMNCDIDSGDDAICFKSTSPRPCHDIYVHDCRISSGWGAIKLGTESMGDMHDILVENCEIYNTKGGGVKVLSADGANLRNVTIRNLKMTDVEMPILVRLCERRLTYRNAAQRPVGSMTNINISDIEAKITSDFSLLRMTPTSAIVVSGTPDNKLNDVTIKNVKITHPGGGTKADAARVMPENITEYPEFTKLGASPVYGMFVRNVKNFSYENIEIILEGEDARQEEIFLNVDRVNKL